MTRPLSKTPKTKMIKRRRKKELCFFSSLSALVLFLGKYKCISPCVYANANALSQVSVFCFPS